ncbi:pentatricopeptide repeat-containing protein At4g16390, chloroplastic [Malania oleifera]|uniref:pentatricopeptide repeat-containing protein At4g16390, chloroplastic n=1 Tax=Malania oleifera TaxID=397392 RepID=UPI0025AE24D9|nr:pentatricopeptide repeat-containing protein At4g16390, chloroplastic [Malania oleifera]
MAYHLCSAPSSLHHHDRHPLPHSLSSSSPKLSLKNFNFIPFKFTHLSSHSGHISLRLFQVSLRDQVLLETQNPNSPKQPESEFPDEKSNSSPKSYVWINPKSARASELRRKSYDSRYATLVKIAESLNFCKPTEEDVFTVLSGLDGDIVEHDAVVVLNNMVNPETALIALKFFQKKLRVTKEVILYNVTMKVFKKCKDLDGAEKLFEEMLERGLKPDNVTFSTIICCARACYLPIKAIDWFQKMPTFGCDPDDITYAAMIDAYGRAGNISMALSLYDRARTEKWRMDAVTFSTMIKIYGMSGNFDGCLNVYEEMKALGVKPNRVIYNTLLDVMGRAKRPWQAKSIFKEMTAIGILPNQATYAALLRVYCRARYGDDAIAVYKAMKEKGMELNVVLYNSVLAMCADLGRVDEGVQIFEDMKNSGTCLPDSWTFSSLITIYSCSGEVSEAEGVLNDMVEAGFEPNIFVLTSLIQCYGKANRTDDVVRTFDKVLELGITPDDWFCGCLLNVMTQTEKEELGKLIICIEKANSRLALVVKLLVKENVGETFKTEAFELFNSIRTEVKRAFCNCLIDLCLKLDLLERACVLFDMGLTLGIYTDMQSKTPTQWSLHLKGLSLGAALTALHVWMNDLAKELKNGEELPPVLGINTGHGKHKYSEKGLAGVFDSHLKELKAPFREAPDKVGWFLTTNVAAASWLESRKSPEFVTA